MADTTQPPAQAADEQTVETATEQAIALANDQAAAESIPNLNPESGANSAPTVEAMDGMTYAQMAKEMREGGLPAEESPATVAPVQPEEPKATDDEEGRTPKRIRLSSLDDVQAEAVILARDLKAEGKPISLAEAEARVKSKYGITDDPKPVETQAANDSTMTPAQIQARITELLAEEEAAANDVDTVKQLKIGREIRALERQHDVALYEEQTAEQAEAAAVTQTAEEMRALYPDFKDRKSRLSLEWEKVHAELQATGSPILMNRADATEYITLKAAKNLGIAPVRASASAKVTPSISPAVARKTPPVQPASGAARTATPAQPVDRWREKSERIPAVERAYACLIRANQRRKEFAGIPVWGCTPVKRESGPKPITRP